MKNIAWKILFIIVLMINPCITWAQEGKLVKIAKIPCENTDNTKQSSASHSENVKEVNVEFEEKKNGIYIDALILDCCPPGDACREKSMRELNDLIKEYGKEEYCQFWRGEGRRICYLPRGAKIRLYTIYGKTVLSQVKTITK